MKKRALISVYDKQGITSFAEKLVEAGYEIISTGGTLHTLQEAGIPALAVEDITTFPEILGGRVKTLHPMIHGGLLAKRDNSEHLQQLQVNDITPIDLVVVNLYPFKETVTKEAASHEEIIENIDIGGPSMLRAAAKNYQAVTVIVDPADYECVLQEIQHGAVTMEKRKQFAAKVFQHTAAYDALIAAYFTKEIGEAFPDHYTITYEKVQTLRYGENPHQAAAFYKQPITKQAGLAAGEQLHGKELSYNNIQDANAALDILAEYNEPTAVAVKHMNPCGIGTASSISKAFAHAYEADPVSVFGGIVACNQAVDKETAVLLSKIFLEMVIAPGFTAEALQLLTEKKNIRLIKLDVQADKVIENKYTSVSGGMLIQTKDQEKVTASDVTVVTEREPSEEEYQQLLFAWKAVKHVKSNAIVLAKGNRTVGIGAGQMNRVGAANIAIEQAAEHAQGAVMASDAFFPMPDTVEAAAKAGITAIIQPGGSKRDQDSIDVCNQYGIAMVYTGVRHFKH
ncbi:bifunctional phosphoribosylaminoimidazolecarboxamide formyltransferase/IMP cyclohydrolase [Virgibacillus pantothenticus]|uniref:bifunctional phosphoribosylaminoimidazolecarboxamide formyltransferase/IMP cyclohydrolase n=1 Tax=Virgibacillus pantothenticus TaxID=1473 RepID=UPI001C22F294|nr:bifunctional phosphoribosylaminoimidazolecarboxamide formyltransferase/IMP cyclohydrolase [Virgibacillus pantothenticus]MBU8568409.1 bifunctional phosphoribosylaminoimidazolecarboxamide formyltransferase/IMP cyclohydrolase [Virgibacillus pantothenticus]MBU8602407.1 bifunctional phosphoribosylaminoimidazolecarboxamide formyltransferase/IMP cyclohydrolase [Virgibacillus pantothenticus]MBU8636543.1 bifunctional phosphoribosylaminoimidazolecarboxamide formyltransferase/IMP cyclohydrolase [Virgiba